MAKKDCVSVGLKDLEGFYAEHDTLRIATGLRHEKPEVWTFEGGGRSEGKQYPPKTHHHIPVKRVGDRIEIEIPWRVLHGEGVTSIRVQWIDYYR